jgi:hypothetical protein
MLPHSSVLPTELQVLGGFTCFDIQKISYKDVDAGVIFKRWGLLSLALL